MLIRVNERPAEVSVNAIVDDVRRREKPDADVLIVNGFPAAGDTVLRDGDEVYLIRRGEIPGRDELERLMAARHTPRIHGLLKQARVGIAGAGGLGSTVAIALARIGVGTLVVADFDVVEPSNLNRQQFFVDQIGMAKVDALKENIGRINPYVAVVAHRVMLDTGNIPDIFTGCRVVVEAFDRADMKTMLVHAVLEAMPAAAIVAASGLAGCGPGNDIQTRRIAGRLFVTGDGVSEARPGSGLMAPRVGIAASHQANQVVRLLLGEDQ